MRGVPSYAFRLFRTIFFLLLSVDCLTMNAGSTRDPVPPFRVSKVPLVFEDTLEWIPATTVINRCYMITSLAAFVAGVGPNVVFEPAAGLAAFTFSFAYAANALDRYQHHYFLCLLLVLLPWARTRPWVQRLVMYTTANLYFWTAVCKVADGGLFLSGAFLRTTAQRRWVFDAVHVAATLLYVEDSTVWSLAAWSVVVVELSLAALLAARELPWVAILLGVSLHLGLEFVGKLSIRFFSWYMICFFILLLPEFPTAQLKSACGEAWRRVRSAWPF